MDGKKPTKQANDQHLEDLKYVPPQSNIFSKVFGFIIRHIKERREAERMRRKHHVLAELEESVRRYDEHYQQKLRNEIESMRNAVLLEAYRAQKRIEKNSIKVFFLVML